MKQEEVKQLHTKTESELKAQLRELRAELFNARMDLSKGKLKNTSLIREKSDNIARVLTVLRARLLAGKEKGVKNV